MSDEINKVLGSKWFVLASNGDVIPHKDEQDAHDSVQRWNEAFPNDAPYHAFQLQVKGTLPEGAIMPKYKVGDRVAHDDGSVGTVRATQIRYLINFYSANLLYADDKLKPAPPIDQMRDEFEKAWASQEQADENEKEAAYLGFRLAKAGAK